MSHEKENNQYYGKYFENAICSIINGTTIENLTGFNFSEEELKEMNEDAVKCANIINGSTAKWVGNFTSSENCDAIIDGIHTEIKYVSGGTGTYLNTTLEYFTNQLGFTSYKEYMKNEIYPFLEQYFGSKVYKNISPVSQEEAKKFMLNYPDEYEVLKKLDKKARKIYVKDLYNFLSNNPNKLAKLLDDILSKNASGKSTPERIVIFNYITKEARIIDKNTIKALATQKVFKNSGLSLSFDGIRMQIGWQNGTALNNPTIRAFIQ